MNGQLHRSYLVGPLSDVVSPPPPPPPADASVLAHSRVRVERLLPGTGRCARAALHSVPLSPPQPPLAGPGHRERYVHTAPPLALTVSISLCVEFPSMTSPYPGYQLRASIYSYGPADSQPSPFALDASIRSAEALSGKQAPFHALMDF